MKFQPLHDFVLLRVESPDNVTPAGLHLPDQSKDKSSRAEVIAVGPGRFNEKGQLIFTQLRPGNKVLFSPYAGTEIEVEHEKYLLIKESEVLGKLEG